MKTKLYLSSLVIASIFTLSPYLFAQYHSQTENITNQQLIANDPQITIAVKDKIAKDASLANVKLTVSTSEGVVNLNGDVHSLDQLMTATVIAESVSGVKDVDTTGVIITKSEVAQQTVADAVITAKVKGMYIQKKLFNGTDLPITSMSIETNNGIVTLSGTTDNQEQIDNAIDIAKTVNGVSAVKSDLTIRN